MFVLLGNSHVVLLHSVNLFDIETDSTRPNLSEVQAIDKVVVEGGRHVTVDEQLPNLFEGRKARERGARAKRLIDRHPRQFGGGQLVILKSPVQHCGYPVALRAEQLELDPENETVG
jgi:hypothetical protein